MRRLGCPNGSNRQAATRRAQIYGCDECNRAVAPDVKTSLFRASTLRATFANTVREQANRPGQPRGGARRIGRPTASAAGSDDRSAACLPRQREPWARGKRSRMDRIHRDMLRRMNRRRSASAQFRRSVLTTKVGRRATPCRAAPWPSRRRHCWGSEAPGDGRRGSGAPSERKTVKSGPRELVRRWPHERAWAYAPISDTFA
jgi:hypothetical protein